MYLDESIIVTQYARSIANESVCEPEPDTWFSHYDLFCLQTWLAPILRQQAGPELGLVPITIETDQAMQLVFNPSLGDQQINLDSTTIDALNQMVKTAPQGRCLVYDYRPLTSYSMKPIPLPWIKQMLPYVSIDQTYEPQLTEHGLSIVIPPPTGTERTLDQLLIQGQQLSRLIVGPSRLEGYLEIFHQLSQSIIDQLRQMYDRGYIVNAGSIAKDWALEQVDEGGLVYRPTWHDNRWIDDMYMFLEQRLAGATDIWLPIQPSYIYRHLIAERGLSTTFSDYKVRLEASTLSQARRLVNQVQDLSSQLTGQVRISRQPIEGAISYTLDGIQIWSVRD